MSITTECMVVNLQIGTWAGTRLDREASREVTEQANAEGDAARVNKHLIPRDILRPIVSASSAMRNHFYYKTLPWKDNGDRLLSRKMYYDFIDEHEKLKFAFDKEVGVFLETTYPSAVARAEFRMGKLFNADDYPSADQLKRRFYANLDIDAITEAHDFRVKLSNDHIQRVQKTMETALNERLAKALNDVWSRLATTLQHYASKMQDEDAVFRNATVENLREIVDMLPALNITNDPNLEKIRQNILNDLHDCFDAAELRKDTTMRKKAGTQAGKIVNSMQAYMAAFKA